jgi:hypothetical protein
LDYARAGLDTRYGRAASGWRKEGDAVILTVVVPPNASATIHLPARDPDSVSVSEDPDRLIFQKMENGHAVYRAFAGKHVLKSKVSR